MNTPRHNAGFGLLEVLIAMLVIAVGLLGISALQFRASQAEMESYQRAQALLLVDDMVNRLRANASAQDLYAGKTVGTGTDATPTTGNATADTDLAEWHDLLLGAAETLGGANVGALIDARGCITYDDATFSYTVTIAWQGLSETFAPTGNACGSGAYGAETKRRVASTTFRIGTL